FAQVIGSEFPQHTFHFWGVEDGEILKNTDWTQFKNIYFHGKFQSPKDLDKIYSAIDINIVCYDTQSENVKIAEPNKFYESIYFNKPIVVSRDTFLEKRVKALNTGFSILANENAEISRFIKNLKTEELTSIQLNCT